MPVVLYGYEAWSITLREERRLRLFENRILRRLFEPKRDENGEWRRLQNEEIHSSYILDVYPKNILSFALRHL